MVSQKAKAWAKTAEGEYEEIEGYEEKRGKRPVHLTTGMTLRISKDAKEMLVDIADYEFLGGKVSEVVRRWISEKIDGYRKNPRFKQYLNRKAELIAEGKAKAMEERQKMFQRKGKDFDESPQHKH